MHRQVDDITTFGDLCSKGTLGTVLVQGLDLRAKTELLLSADAAGAVFLGCELDDRAEAHVTRCGGLVFPRIPELPYDPYRPRLYTVDELMDGYVRGEHATFQSHTRDARIHEHYRSGRDNALGPAPLEALSQRLHDHAIDDALLDLLRPAEEPPKQVVGIMGGHAMRRDDPAFVDVVKLARTLAERGRLVATGGGPGAMEAGNLGAWLAGRSDEDLRSVVQMLEPAPTYEDDGWFDTAYSVRERFDRGADSLAVPTWFYGHEPTNLFPSHVAKYFSNSLREDGLLAIATHGVIYAPGSAGTVQEVFMDAAQNHYGTFAVVSPMVFLNHRYWTEQLPVLPLLEKLAGERQYAELVTVVDDPAQAVEFLESHPPVPYSS